MSDRDTATLMDIARSCEMVGAFIAGMDQKSFLEDSKTQSAVLHQLMLVGEAVKRLSMPFRHSHPSISWALIAGMRDVLIHAYDTVDLEEVWQSATTDIPALLAYLLPLLPSQPDENTDTQ